MLFYSNRTYSIWQLASRSKYNQVPSIGLYKGVIFVPRTLDPIFTILVLLLSSLFLISVKTWDFKWFKAVWSNFWSMWDFPEEVDLVFCKNLGGLLFNSDGVLTTFRVLTKVISIGRLMLSDNNSFLIIIAVYFCSMASIANDIKSNTGICNSQMLFTFIVIRIYKI